MQTNSLNDYLESLKREECYRVDSVLKESPHEHTQLISFVGENGASQGPYIRKYIERESGMGNVYQRIFDAQRNGQRFKHIPLIYECYLRDDALVVVMEFVRGETLQDYVYKHDPSIQLARAVFPMLCDAVTELHESFSPPIIHRDLKPSNLIFAQKALTIIDYGIAREFDMDAHADTTHLGTKAFAPPEQFGYGQTTVRSDVYALGMLLYYCLTETIPTASIREAGFTHPAIPTRVQEVIGRATAFDPQQRFASAVELKYAFLDALHMETADAKLPSPPSKAPVTQNVDALPYASDEKRGISHVIGKIYNFVLAAIFLLLLVTCVYNIFNPPESMQNYSPVYNTIAYGFMVPVFIASLGIALLDKRRLIQRFPQLARLKSWRAWILAALTFLLCLLIAGFLSLVADVS